MSTPIAIVGLACVFPDARTPADLWDNVLAQRRAFRRLPSERLRAEDYLSPDRTAPDRTYVAEAACIEGYEFDRVAFRIVGSTYRSADLAHWLALDVASQALEDAGFHHGSGLPRETTGVVLGNTLTGEFSRAGLMRLRWPYVRRVLDAALAQQSWTPEKRRDFLAQLEAQYKAPFPPVGEESLAGGLSNTIAGRICNHFDLKGGGYTVDGACASSLLAVAQACTALSEGDLDVALAGGVDLSLDPFEIVGFAKTGALAPELMRVYDVRSAGFWPGEGCGFAVLMRLEDALAGCRRIYAVVRGWGVSSDGAGGITRPEVEGQLQALHRAYRRAAYGADSVAFFEGHGTGTAVGDETELRVLARARREARARAPAAAIGSIKANIGHCKAAAGIAGFIKATFAVHSQTLPPTTGCEQPHPELAGPAAALRVLREPEPWPVDQPLRAGISAMGFGGINTHVTIEGHATERRARLSPRERALADSVQDCELFLFAGSDTADLRRQVEQVGRFAARLSRSELADLAAALERHLQPGRLRAAVIATAPAELARKLETLRAWLDEPVTARHDVTAGIFLGDRASAPRLGFLFPGQGSPANLGGGIYRRRFASVRELYEQANLPVSGGGVATQIAQPAIVTASSAVVRVLHMLGLEATVAVGHSLGELTALCWAGAYDEAALLRIAKVRGQAMAELGAPTGTMAAIAAPAREVKPLLPAGVSIVGFNSPRQTVVAGEAALVKQALERATEQGLRGTPLPVSHAFHTPLVAAATPVLLGQLVQENIGPLRRRVVSTISGAELKPGDDLRALLCRQVTSPVLFQQAVAQAADNVDLWIEAGPGRVLTGLAADCQSKPVLALDAGGPSLTGLFQVVGLAFVLGAPVRHAALFHGRFTRPFDLDWQPKFFVNPCEQAPAPDVALTAPTVAVVPDGSAPPLARAPVETTPLSGTPLEIVRRLVAERAELPVAAVQDDHRLLGDLHLNSITVGQLVGEAARALGLPPLLGVTEFANATVGAVAQALEEWQRHGGTRPLEPKRAPAGVDSWVRAFVTEWVEGPLPGRPPQPSAASNGAGWRVFAPPDHPLAAQLTARLAEAGGAGVVVCLPAAPDFTKLLQEGGCVEAEAPCLELLLKGAKEALARGAGSRFVLVQHGWNAGGFARTLFLESPQIATAVVEVPPGHPHAADWVVAEALNVDGYREARYDTAGRRWLPKMKAVPLAGPEPAPTAASPLGAQDVVLVSGGGKGITFECALALARRFGVKLALLGRAQPEKDAELAGNLKRLTDAGVAFRYWSADVTDAASVRHAVAAAERELGKVTAILHGAGHNVPQPLSALDERAIQRTLSPKIVGLRNLLAAVPREQLRLLVTFSSIIGRVGLPGEADYALANDWLSQLTERYQAAHPHCRCLALEWSVWSGVGMGARLGRLEALTQQGITPIPPETGAEFLVGALRHPPPATAFVVAGRFGEPPTVAFDAPALPFLRFLERPRVHYPGVELVADANVSAETDPYVTEHVLKGEALFPAVMGLEAMAQVAMALAGRNSPPHFEHVELARPVVVPRGKAAIVRLAGLVRAPGVVEVTLRCAETGFQVDHFKAGCRFGCGADSQSAVAPVSHRQSIGAVPAPSAVQSRDPAECHSAWQGGFDPALLQAPPVALDPGRDLYEELLFHQGRFRRLRGYRRLRARECVAEIQARAPTGWFGPYLPPALVLGDAGARDAAIHAIQACIPHARLLPIGVDRIVQFAGPDGEDGRTSVFVHAREMARDGDLFTYQLQVLDAAGRRLEQWEGLRLKVVEALPRRRPWPEALLACYLERCVEELIPEARVAVALVTAPDTERAPRSQRALAQVLGTTVTVSRRADGKPEVWTVPGPALAFDADAPTDPPRVSASHAGPFTLAVSASGAVGCDMEPVAARSGDAWLDLLGDGGMRLAGLIARDAAEDVDTAATRVWVARECLKKAGAALDTPLTFGQANQDGWAVLSAGARRIATCVAAVGEPPRRLAIGFLVGPGAA